MHCLPVLIAASVFLTGAISKVLAQEPSRPTLTIARFEGALKSSGTTDAGADLADVVASRMEESGCCRVMSRAFLPQAAPGQSPSLEAIREAAVASRVQYVVAGRAVTSRAIRRPTAPSIAAMLGQMRPGASAFPPGSVGAPLAPRLPYPIAAPPRPVTLVTLEMRIIDAAGGQVLRTVTVTRPAGANGAGMTADSIEVSDALVRALADLERQRR
jgi:hypothetical protein